jgi:hypothetical protein
MNESDAVCPEKDGSVGLAAAAAVGAALFSDLTPEPRSQRSGQMGLHPRALVPYKCEAAASRAVRWCLADLAFSFVFLGSEMFQVVR